MGVGDSEDFQDGNSFLGSLAAYTCAIAAVVFGTALAICDLSKRPPTLHPADLNNDGQRQEYVGFYKNVKSAYFPDTNGVYQLDKDFDWNTVNSNELERIAMEAQQ